ncbi:hypothetical protein CAPTEDRAFT_219076 [Capitella teleta]|uniref:Uncharacterized protein n=1 Tax=Capitella teleta TaxID=283909 RepID=R7V448_CAPTE|nr:hypothetical protein CAPTEDRAFT_219076 [Capitella teleta]|eukprot:ELU13339.1 hypothetical protein CAPTEDRAFT_219076 [Capitella teleta]
MGKKEIAALERRRRDARGQARMMARTLRVALDDANGNVLDVRFHLSELEMALDELRGVQRDYSMTLDDVDYEGNADEAYEFLKELLSLRCRALRHLEELKHSPSLTEKTRPSSCSAAPLNKTPTTPPINCTERVNVSECENFGGVEPGSGYRDQIITLMKGNKLMLMRAFYVLLGVTLIVVVYFAVRTIRWRSRNNRIKRYGLLSQNDDRLEMQPLDQDDDDEDDMTVFDINRK